MPTRNLKSLTIAFTSFALFHASVLPVSAESLQNPIDLLKAALQGEQTAESLHTVELHRDHNFIFKIETYVKIAPDGLVLKRREDKEQPAKNKSQSDPIHMVYIWNRDGFWTVSKKQAVLKTYEKENSKAAVQVDPNWDKPPIVAENNFKVSEVMLRDRACYKVTMTLDENVYKQKVMDRQSIEDAKSSRNATNGLKELNSELGIEMPARKKAETLVPYLYQYTIDRQNKTIWSVKTYMKSGNLIDEHTYEQVEKGLPLADDLFQPPAGRQKFVANSLAEYIKIKNKE